MEELVAQRYIHVTNDPILAFVRILRELDRKLPSITRATRCQPVALLAGLIDRPGNTTNTQKTIDEGRLINFLEI